jgi:activator of 2-hydroxyglutaryl-CoA dehydratase
MNSQTNTVKINKNESDVLGIDIGSLYLRACITRGKNIISTFKVISNGVQNGYVTDKEIFEEDLIQLLLKINSELK